jgi:hypothetical protein
MWSPTSNCSHRWTLQAHYISCLVPLIILVCVRLLSRKISESNLPHPSSTVNTNYFCLTNYRNYSLLSTQNSPCKGLPQHISWYMKPYHSSVSCWLLTAKVSGYQNGPHPNWSVPSFSSFTVWVSPHTSASSSYQHSQSSVCYSHCRYH